MSDEGRSSGGKASQSNARTPTLCCGFGEQRQPIGHGGSVGNGSTEALNNLGLRFEISNISQGSHRSSGTKEFEEYGQRTRPERPAR